MSKLYFVTTNSGKVKTLQNHLRPLDIEVIQEPLDLIEPQADSGEEVALSKSKQAFAILKKPLIVDDSGFVIDELNGFPGPYIKFVLKTVGVEKLLKMTKWLKTRNCHFESSLIYVNKKGIPALFTTKDETGKLAEKIDYTNSSEAWSDLWRIFVPKGTDKTLVSLSFEERQVIHIQNKHKTCYQYFTNWISEAVC